MFSVLKVTKKPSLSLISLCLLVLSISLIHCNPSSCSSNNTNTSQPLTSPNTPGLLGDDSVKGCWLRSYGRGVGKPVSTCAAGQEKNGALCYPNCQSGYNGNGPVCWQQCPSGFTNNGAYCLKPKEYGRGTGYTNQNNCNNQNSQGCEKWGLRWYPKCAANFHNSACCLCSPNCPSGMLDIGISCQKQSYGRGAGTPMSCAADQQEDAALCYKQCKNNYRGAGPVCWGQCPSGWYQCGALCMETKEECTLVILEIANKVAEAFNEEGEEDEDDEELNYAKTGIDVGNQLASFPVCP